MAENPEFQQQTKTSQSVSQSTGIKEMRNGRGFSLHNSEKGREGEHCQEEKEGRVMRREQEGNGAEWKEGTKHYQCDHFYTRDLRNLI